MNDLFTDDEPVFVEDQNRNYLEELVGENKKFKDVNELAKGKAASDAFIAQLTDEQKRLRDELSTRINMEKFLDQLNAAQSQLNNQNSQGSGDQPSDKSALTPQDLEQLVANKLRQYENDKTATQNINLVQNKLREVYGPNFAQKLRQQAADLDMTESEVKDLASKNPKALFKLLGVGEQTKSNNFETPPRTQTNSFSLPSGQKRGYSYYEDIRKQDRNLYFSPKVQNEMYARLKEIGEDAFYNS